MSTKSPKDFDFTKAQNIVNNIYNLSALLEDYCKNQPVKMAEFDYMSTSLNYLRQNSDKLSCMFSDYADV